MDDLPAPAMPINDIDLFILKTIGGAKGDRTPDLNAASVALSQLSYVPGRVGGVPKGIRTPVAGVKGRCPRPTRRWGPINKQIIMKES